jgi:hypothetical protein
MDSRKGTASIAVLSVSSNGMTYTGRLLEEMMEDKAAPLDWLDFEQKYRDRRPGKEDFINELNVSGTTIRNKDEH